jgi:hypothetical protein
VGVTCLPGNGRGLPLGAAPVPGPVQINFGRKPGILPQWERIVPRSLAFERTKINSSDPPLTAVSTAYPAPPFLTLGGRCQVKDTIATLLFVTTLPDTHHASTLQTGSPGWPLRLLVIDEVGYPFEPEASNLFFQLVDTRTNVPA